MNKRLIQLASWRILWSAPRPACSGAIAFPLLGFAVLLPGLAHPSLAQSALRTPSAFRPDRIGTTEDSRSALGNPYLFQGARYDPETGFYYFRNRYYDPRAGRFLQRDPVWDEQNVGGWYTFVGNGPVARRDPLGFQECKTDPDQSIPDSFWQQMASMFDSRERSFQNAVELRLEELLRTGGGQAQRLRQLELAVRELDRRKRKALQSLQAWKEYNQLQREQNEVFKELSTDKDRIRRLLGAELQLENIIAKVSAYGTETFYWGRQVEGEMDCEKDEAQRQEEKLKYLRELLQLLKEIREALMREFPKWDPYGQTEEERQEEFRRAEEEETGVKRWSGKPLWPKPRSSGDIEEVIP